MRIVWDEPKRLVNLAKHGMDFAALDDDFFDGAVLRRSYSGRILAIGRLRGGAVIAVVFRKLGGAAASVVSTRPASKQERRLA